MNIGFRSNQRFLVNGTLVNIHELFGQEGNKKMSKLQ